MTALLITTMGTAFATPLSESRSQLNNAKKLYNEAVKKVEQMEIDAEKLDSKIEFATIDLQQTTKKVADSKNAITKTEGEIKVIEKNIDKEQDLFGARMEAMYMNGVTSYLDVLLGAENFGDFISRIDTVKTLIQYDNQIMAGLNTQKTMLANKKHGLVKEQSSLVALEKESKAKLEALNKRKSEQKTLIANLTAKQKTYAADIRAYQNAVSESLSVLNSSNSSKPGKSSNTSTSSKSTNSSRPSKPSNNNSNNVTVNVPNRGNGDASGMEIVSYGKQFLGVPYVWGGTTPSGFDCSGFTSYVYRNAAGISLPRTSGDQANVGTYIGSKGSLQPGDLVFFGSPTHHVGIYIGGGQYIHSPRTGDVVKISPLTRSDFTHGRRVL